MIVVATSDFEVYHGVVNELRDRGVPFTTREPDEPLPEDVSLLITSSDEESVDFPPAIEIVRADSDAPRRAVETALTLFRGGSGQTIIGIDPGDRPGIAVLSGDMVVAVFRVPLSDAATVVCEEIEDAADPMVRIGDGARLKGARVIDDLPDITVELVDETGTTPSLGTGARGMGDVIAAVNIARIEGREIESRTIEPTAGELKRIKQRSRERSDGDRTIDETLARRVASGELSLDEALRQHREQ